MPANTYGLEKHGEWAAAADETVAPVHIAKNDKFIEWIFYCGAIFLCAAFIVAVLSH